MDQLGLGYDDRARGQRRRRLRVALRLRRRPARTAIAGRVRHRDPGLRRPRREPGRSRRRHAGVPAPDRGRQGHGAVRVAGDHRRAVRARAGHRRPARRALDARRGRVVPVGRLRRATRCCSTPTDRSRRASSPTFRPFRFADGWGIVHADLRCTTSPGCAKRSASTATTTRASRRSASAWRTARRRPRSSRGATSTPRVAAWPTRRARFEAERVPFAMIVSPAELPDRSARGRGRAVRAPRPSRRREDPPAPPSGAVRRDPRGLDR